MRLMLALLGTVFGSRKLVGWKVQHFGRDNLRLLYSEIFARQNYRFVSEKRDPTILDCGANIGMATLFFKWLYPQARITAFEPDPITFKALERNVSDNNLQNVAVHNAALAHEEMQLPFHVPETGSLMMSAVAGRAGGRTITVPAKRLSSFITGEIDLLKLDVEGMEGPILQELAESGKLQSIREAFIEVHHNLEGAPATLASVLQILENAGFHYHVADAYSPSSDCSTFQDVLIHARRRLCR
jgi:FkbM family methyltransferase